MRASGILMHITSLPSPYGIGTLGREAYAFADFLKKAGQKYWQILPLGPTGFGDSPYQTDSAFAGNPYLIDLDALTEEGLLTPDEIDGAFRCDNGETVDYGAVFSGRRMLLHLAYQRGWERDRAPVEEFFRENEAWLRNYALFTAAKRHFGGKAWTEWEDEALRRRSSEEVLHRYEEMLREDMEECIYTQFLFFRQWDALRSYIRENGISVIGDVPIYVPMDSADVWAERELFRLDDEGRPTEVAGVPPDYFTEDGQLWGNPLYDWERMAADGYSWWIRRLSAAFRLYDVVRIDHFRGLESYWAVPYGEPTARSGHWRRGPGENFIRALQTAFPERALIAEDLGILTPAVLALRDFSGYPGMKVLQFAFSANETSSYLPHLYEHNCVCYTGTHDNTTLRGWAEEMSPEDRAYAREYMGIGESTDLCDAVLRSGMRSVADLFMAQMQDWLDLGGESRMNVPGVLGHGNWCWRMKKDALTEELAQRIRRMTELYSR